MISLPEGIAKRHIAVLGMNGSGKTSVAKREIVEPALIAKARVCVIDPTGVWWGLRLGIDGSPKNGFKVYIVGGEHGDFKIAKRDGKTWAEIVGTSADSFVFDTSQMTVADRTAWFTDFAEALILKNKGPLILAIDEAHLFAPQGGAKAGGLAPDMLHATNNLLALGRSKGLRVTMISQRPAKLHKDALTQAHTLFAMKVMAPHDRQAVKDWVADNTDPERAKEIIASLATLKPGEAWVWAPADDFLQRIKFPLPRTFDSSRAPEDGEDAGPALPAIDPAAVEARLKAVAADAVANDPKTLKATVARLEVALKAAESTKIVGPNQAELQDAVEAGFVDGTKAGTAAAAEAMKAAVVKAVNDGTDAINVALANLSRALGAAPEAAKSVPMHAPTPVPHRSIAAPPLRHRAPARVPDGDHGDVTKPQRKILESLAFWMALGHVSPSRAQVGVVAGYSPTSGGFANLLSQLKIAGLIDYPATNAVALTDDGLALGIITEGGPVHDRVRGLLSGPQSKLFDALMENPTEPVTRETLGSMSGYSATSGGFANLLSELSTLKIVYYPRKGAVQLEEWVLA